MICNNIGRIGRLFIFHSSLSNFLLQLFTTFIDKLSNRLISIIFNICDVFIFLIYILSLLIMIKMLIQVHLFYAFLDLLGRILFYFFQRVQLVGFRLSFLESDVGFLLLIVVKVWLNKLFFEFWMIDLHIFVILHLKSRRDAQNAVFLSHIIISHLLNQSNALIADHSRRLLILLHKPLIGGLKSCKYLTFSIDTALSSASAIHCQIKDNQFKLAQISDIIQCTQQRKQAMTEHHVVGFNLGNKTVQVVFGSKEIRIGNSILFERENVYIGKKPNYLCLVDGLLLLGLKYDDPMFVKISKYYNYTCKEGVNQNVIFSQFHQTLLSQFFIEFPLLLILKGVYLTNPHLKYMTLSQKPIKMIVTVFDGLLNPSRLSLQTCITIIGIKSIYFVNSNNCIATFYLKMNKKKRDDSEKIGIIDFGDVGMTFSIYKLYSTSLGIVEVLDHAISYIGGNCLTNILVDYVVKQLIRTKGMDITKIPKIMHKLKVLCQQAKHVLSTNDKAFIRIDQLPDILVYGCEVTLEQFQKHINSELQANISMIKHSLSQKGTDLTKVLLTGGSSNIPLFKKLLLQHFGHIKFVNSDPDWLNQGLLQIKSGLYHVLDIVSFDLKMEGDEKFSYNIIQRGEQIPVRKKILMKFPSGQLTYSMKFYQNDVLIGKCFIPERPRQNRYNLYVEVDHNKMLSICATTSQGLIKMNSNMMQIPDLQYKKYQQILDKLDFHIENN